MADDKDDDFNLVRLDRSRTHDKVTPPERGAFWLQDGLHFDNHGYLAPDWLTEEDKSVIRRKIARAKAEQAGEKAKREALRKAGIDPDQAEDAAPTPPKPGKAAAPKAPAELAADSATVDLVAWARGETKVTWFKVKQAFVAQHAREVDNKEDALIFLADNNLISPDEVGV